MSNNQVEYLIVGAGPAGLQLAYFLEMAQRSYLVLEAEASAARFFKKFPRHGKLISINKVKTGYSDPEINLRWDWNSLISHDPDLNLAKFSQEYFPPADAFVEYCETYAERFQLNIRYNARIEHVTKTADKFQVSDQQNTLFEADRLIIATGLSQPYVPPIPGIELAENYTKVSVDPQDFSDQRVLIIGKGNSGFETADNLVSTTSLIHVVSPEPIKMAWRTKYVGHLRAVNNNFLDTYQLKSQNAILDANVLSIEHSEGEFKVAVSYSHANGEQEVLSYDRVIICTGFQFDNSIFDASCRPLLSINDRFPTQTSEWESVNVPDLYFAGVLMHMRDFKQKQSGFIHGFRHNIQSLHQIFECKYHQQAWPSQTLEAKPQDITEAILARVNSSAGLWQQTGFLCDVVVVDETQQQARYYRDLPRDYVHSSLFGKSLHYYVVTLEFGHDVAKLADPFAINRLPGAEHADASAFLHPIIRRYTQNLLVDEVHLVEDLAAEWKKAVHIVPLSDFIRRQLASPLPAPLPTPAAQPQEADAVPIPDPNQRFNARPGTRKRLGEYLIDAGLINQVQLRYALLEQEKSNLRLGEIMVRNGWLTPQTVDFFVAQFYLTPSVV